MDAAEIVLTGLEMQRESRGRLSRTLSQRSLQRTRHAQMTLHTFGIRLPIAYSDPEELMNKREASGDTTMSPFIEARGPQPTAGASQPAANLLDMLGLEFDSRAHEPCTELQANDTRGLEHDLLVTAKLGKPEVDQFL